MEAAGKRLATHASRLGAAAALAVSACAVSLKGPTLFSWHPILMSAAYVGAMSAGILAYVGPVEEKKANREWHRALQIVAFVLALLGLAAIMLNKVRMGKSVVPGSIHAYFGTLALALTLGQSSVGLSKYAQISSRGFSDCKFHGDMGRATFTVASVATALGIAKTFSGAVGWVLIALTQGVAGIVLLISLRRYPSRLAHYAAAPHELNDATAAD